MVGLVTKERIREALEIDIVLGRNRVGDKLIELQYQPWVNEFHLYVDGTVVDLWTFCDMEAAMKTFNEMRL